MRLTEKVHQILTAHLRAGDLVIDATAGNGHDTLFLAKQVEASGTVIAIDIQAAAIESTRERIVGSELVATIDLQIGDHGVLLNEVAETSAGKVRAITFNLGYLPGSDHTVQTCSESTLPALEASLKCLAPAGILCVTAYRGHAGGMDEANLVEDWMHQQGASGHQIQSFVPESQNNPPILWMLKKTQDVA